MVNITAAGNQSILAEFPYLDQNSHVIINSTSLAAQLINVPYQTFRSLVSSFVERYEAVHAPVEQLPPNESTNPTPDYFWTSVTYFLSGYAASCLFVAVVLNRLVAMSSLRSTNQQLKLAPWAKLTFHMIALVSLGYTIVQTGAQFGLYGVQQPASSYLSTCYGILCLSHCIETFITTTANLKPLEESDYSLFELSSAFYQLSKFNASVELYGYTCIACLLGRFLIHFVEILNIRHYRIVFSTILNVPFSLYMIYLQYTSNVSSLGSFHSFHMFKNGPKILSISIVILSYVCYKLSCLVRMGNFGARSGGTSRVEELQFHSFWKNWPTYLNLSGEEDFYAVALKFAVFLCNPKQAKSNGIHREFEDVTTPRSLHKSYFVSGYMNKVDTVPVQELDFKRDLRSTSVWKLRISWYMTMVKYLYLWIRYFLKGKNNRDTKDETERNFNDFVTENNYVKFLHVKDEKDTDKFLLPEEDYTDDYVPVDSEPEDNYDELYDDENESDDYDDGEYELTAESKHQQIDHELYEKNRQLAIAQELFNPEQIEELIRSPNEMSWYLSTWAILNFENVANERMLTRRRFAKHNELGILREVLAEQSPKIQEIYDHPPSHDSDEEAVDLACVVCKTSTRNIILWPCKCLALCESCRMSLGLRGFNTCICCRRDVSGYSKLNIV
ncbi:unnamed protein product [Kluyveromyces dobzhanskii CBS 2104]|uniref:WGS project CCBQ000000000 data, contig 00058 n=1 Tax=Kluyveromyces dobzhanskii CBS 2104 TaxID=1427455 RepID=A0A0A8LD98_9SACH|nr:unnamed protein product [Kluyveromyces dobzhanskii CBS 2104]